MTTIMERICLHGQKKETEDLKDLVSTLNMAKLTEIITKNIHSPTFLMFFNYLLEGFADLPQAHDTRFGAALTVLRHLQIQAVSNAQQQTLVSRMCDELQRFKSEHLIELCTFCTECIQKGNSTNLCWKEIFPMLLNVIVERDAVVFNREELTSLEYKTQLISSLLMMEWSPNIITPMTNMFTSIPLNKQEHGRVVAKLVNGMEKLTPQEVPAFFYQMLILCQAQNGRSIFLRLQHYFDMRLYANPAATNANSDDMNMICESSDLETVQAEGTVLFHIQQSVPSRGECIRDYLTFLKTVTKCPELILHPFQLSLLLTISTVSMLEERVFEIIKTAIFRSFCEDHKKSESCWFRENAKHEVKVSSTLVQMVKSSVNERPIVMQGLINLSFALLGSGVVFGKEVIIGKLWNLGNLIILQVIKRSQSVSHVIVQKLVNYINSGHQYIKCLRLLSNKYGLILLENKGYIIQLMENMIHMPGNVGEEILDSLIPLTKKSFTMRDYLILLLRKALNSQKLETRQMAVNGFLKLIIQLKYTNLTFVSQSSSSSSSMFSQVFSATATSKSKTFSNETLCLEVLSILQNCFKQQPEVKIKLYDGLYDAVCTNPDLCVPILDLLWVHFNKYYELEGDELLPLKFSKLVQIKEADAILVEPLGKLIFSIGLIVTKVTVSEMSNPTVIRIVNAFQHLTEKMAICELEHFNLDDGTDLLDILPESEEKMLHLKEAISVYEALIGYNVCSWTADSENQAKNILGLFAGFNRLIQYSKNLSKPKKGEKRKNVNKTTQQTQPTACTSDVTRKDSAKKVFKRNDTVLNFHVLEKMLKLLQNPSVNWASKEEANVLKKEVELHRYVLLAIINLLQQFKQLKDLNEYKNNTTYTSCSSVAHVLHKRCVSRFNEFSTFDWTTAALAVEAFYLLLKFVNAQYENKWGSFLSGICSLVNDDLIEPLTKIIGNFKPLIDAIDEDTSLDAESVKFFQTVVSTISLLGSHVPPQTNLLSTELLEWTNTIIVEKKMKGKILVTDFVMFTFDQHIKFKSTTVLFKNFAVKVAEVLGTISEHANDEVQDIAIIDESTANVIFLCLCNKLKVMLDDIDWIVLRMRSEYCVMSCEGEDRVNRNKESLKEKERNMCSHIYQVVSLMMIMSDICVAPGPNSEALIKCLTHLYNTLTNLTKYFSARSNKVEVAFQTARFDFVVKQTGKKLSPLVYNLILFMDHNQKAPETATRAAKKKSETNALKAKVLKQMRTIPKLIYEMEQFSRAIVQLTTKTNVDLQKYVGQGTTRDFRIINLITVLKDNPNRNDEDPDESTVSASASSNTSISEDGADKAPAKRQKKAK